MRQFRPQRLLDQRLVEGSRDILHRIRAHRWSPCDSKAPASLSYSRSAGLILVYLRCAFRAKFRIPHSFIAAIITMLIRAMPSVTHRLSKGMLRFDASDSVVDDALYCAALVQLRTSRVCGLRSKSSSVFSAITRGDRGWQKLLL